MKDKKSVPLTNLIEGQSAVIVSIKAGRKAAKRISDLGLTPETQIKVLRKVPFLGPLEIESRGSKLIIGRGIAAKILVRVF